MPEYDDYLVSDEKRHAILDMREPLKELRERFDLLRRLFVKTTEREERQFLIGEAQLMMAELQELRDALAIVIEGGR